MTAKDFFRSNLGQKQTIAIIITKEKFPSLCSVKREKKMLSKMKRQATTLYFISENKTKKENTKNIMPILWINGPFNGFLKGHSKILWSVKTVSAPIKIKIKRIERKFIIIVKISTSLSFINQNEIAAAYSGNLIQAIPLTREFSINEEKYEETIKIQKNNNAHFIQGFFNQYHENFNDENIKKENAIITINISVIALLIIIEKGINDQIRIKVLSKIDFDLSAVE